MEKPIAKCQAIKAKINETGKGIFVTFLIKDEASLPVEEFIEGLRKMRVGEVCNLYCTVDGE